MKRKNLIFFMIYSLLGSLAFERALFVLFLNEKQFLMTQIAILQTALFWSCFAAEIPSGWIADRFGRRRAVAAGTILMALSVAGQFIAEQFMSMMIFFVLHGISFALISGASQALLFDSLKADGRETEYLRWAAVSRWAGAIGLGASMGMGGILQRGSWATVYGASVVGLLFGAASIAMVKEKRPTPESVPDRLDARPGFGFTRPQLKSLIVAALPFALVQSAVTPYFVLSQKLLASYGLDNRWISGIMSTSEIGGAFLCLGIGWISTRLSAKKAIPAMIGSLAVLLALNWTHSAPLSVILFLLINALSMIFLVFTETYFQERLPSESRATGLSVVSFVNTGAVGFAYVIQGALMDRLSPNAATAITSLAPIIALIWLCLSERKLEFRVSESSEVTA